MIENIKMDNKDIEISFIGIGAQKCATTWLYHCLREHPEICGFKGKETHFFSNEEKYTKGISYYKKLFENCSFNKVVGEFSTSYLSSLNSPQRIKDNFPNVKLIVIVRNPADRAISHIKHLMSKNRVDKKLSIDKIIEKFPETIENGLYGKHIENYFKFFSKENLLVLFYEDILKDEKKVLNKTFSFLEVDNNFLPIGLEKKINSSKIRLSPFHNLFNKVYLKMRNNFVGKFFIKVIKFFGITSYRVDYFLALFTKKEDFLKEFDKKKIKKYFTNDIDKLEQLLNINLYKWK